LTILAVPIPKKPIVLRAGEVGVNIEKVGVFGIIGGNEGKGVNEIWVAEAIEAVVAFTVILFEVASGIATIVLVGNGCIFVVDGVDGEAVLLQATKSRLQNNIKKMKIRFFINLYIR
jgi:hypothetical protein